MPLGFTQFQLLGAAAPWLRPVDISLKDLSRPLVELRLSRLSPEISQTPNLGRPVPPCRAFLLEIVLIIYSNPVCPV